ALPICTELYSRNGTIAARTDHAPVPARGAAARRSRPGRGPAGSRRRARPRRAHRRPLGPRGRTGSPGLRSGPGRCGRRPSGRGHGHGRGRGAAPAGYVVRPGDTLWSISARLLGNPYDYVRVALENELTNPDLILPGWELRLPPAGPEESGEEPAAD